MTTTETEYLTPTRLTATLLNTTGKLAEAMPRPTPESVQVKLYKLVRRSDRLSPWVLSDKGETNRPQVTANLRPSRFAPEFKKADAEALLRDLFSGIDSKTFKGCPDSIVWEKALEYANSDAVGLTPQDALTLSRALNRLLVIRAGGGELGVFDLP